jgi:uncharacterized protein YqgC (DUF456 family)
MRRVSLIFAVVVVAVLVCGGVASAITYGQPDGSRHSNVGALVGTFDRPIKSIPPAELSTLGQFVAAVAAAVNSMGGG